MNNQQQGPASNAGPTVAGGSQPQNATAAMQATGQMYANQLPPQLMGLVSNPAIAGAAGQLFPHPAMLSNPSAFLAMSEAFAAGMQQSAGQQQQMANQAGMMMPQFANMMANAQQMAQPMAQAQNNAYGGNGNQNNATTQAVLQPAVQNQNNGGGGQTMVLAAPTNSMPPQYAQMGVGQMQSLPQHAMSAPQGHSVASAPASAAPSKPPPQTDSSRGRKGEVSADERAKQNRDRNREHARSTRLRKKAYVQKLKELVEGLHAERSEEMRKRRVAMQHLAEVQNVRRTVVNSFLHFHSEYESDPRKWSTILEDNFWFKQPITPYRSFRRGEIEQVRDDDDDNVCSPLSTPTIMKSSQKVFLSIFQRIL